MSLNSAGIGTINLMRSITQMPDSSVIAAPSLFPGALARSLRPSARTVKIAVAATLLSAGAFGLLEEQHVVSSSDAVVSAYVLDVRTPIDGILSGLPLATGTLVKEGETLGHLENPRTDPQHLDNLHSLENAASDTAEALAAEREELLAQRADLLRRVGRHTAAISDRIQAQVNSASGSLAAHELLREQASIELERGRRLHDAGIIASADFDRLSSAHRVAAEQVSVSTADLATLHKELASARNGILTDVGAAADVTYSRQRVDEISLKLIENQRLLTTALREAAQAQATIAAESARVALMRGADLVSPIDGILWKLGSINGEHAASGDSVLSLVDCSRQFLIVGIPQDRLPDVALHGQARFRLAGESAERTGTVLSVSGEAQSVIGHKLAATPEHLLQGQLASVIVTLDTPSGTPSNATAPSCLVGRTARVLLPTVPTHAFAPRFHLGL